MKTLKISAILFFLISSSTAQSLMPKVSDSNVEEILNKPAIVSFYNDSLINCTVVSAILAKGSLMNISFRLVDGSKQKIKLDQIKWVKIRLANSVEFSIRDESGNLVKDIINSYIVFEHPFSTKGKPKPTLMQVLNPGFDSRIKIFADSNVATDKSILIRGVPLSSNDEISSYFFVKNAEVVNVRPSDYQKKFDKLFGDCVSFITSVKPEQTGFENLMGHLILYDRLCSN